MGVYIEGMKMPTIGRILITLPSGRTLEVSADSTQNILREAKAVPVPEHGRVIEESKVLDIVSEWCPDDDGSVGKVGDLREMLDEIESLPTILEAEEVKES